MARVLVFGMTVWYSGILPSTLNKVVAQSKIRINSSKTKQNVDILCIIMGEAKSHPMWKKRIANITGSVSLLYGSFDEEIPSNNCEIKFGFFCEETIFIPGTTWTQGRNLLAAQAVRKERKREKKYDYWIFIDDDVSPVCEGGEPMEQFFGKGNCWQKLFNFISSDQVPEKVSTLALAYKNSGPSGFVGVSNTDAMFAAFKREKVPYLLPYATIREGGSEWTSQAALFCAIQTCMKSSVMFIPYIRALNEAHREYIRGLNITEISETIANNYHDDKAGFKPCQKLRMDQLSQERSDDKSSTFITASHLNNIIPEPELEICEPMKKRFEQWESQIESEISKSYSGHVQPLVQT